MLFLYSVILNVYVNVCCRLIAETDNGDKPTIAVKSYPFQQSYQPGFNVEPIISSVLLGMIFVLIPVSLTTDMVHDREV